jgi:hypothetical protein
MFGIENTKTNTISMNDWLRVTEHMIISADINTFAYPNNNFIEVNFEHDLDKVSKEQNLPVGEHIKEAIQIIRGK